MKQETNQQDTIELATDRQLDYIRTLGLKLGARINTSKIKDRDTASRVISTLQMGRPEYGNWDDR